MAIVDRNPAEIPQPGLDLGIDLQERLNQEAAFSLHGHELVDPTTERGYVSRIDQIEPISMAGNKLPRGVRLYEIGVVDPFVAADPEGYAIVKDHVTKLERLIRREGFVPLEERRKEHPYMKNGDATEEAKPTNMFTKAWLAGENVAALAAWRTNVPNAEALGYLVNPVVGAEITRNTKKPTEEDTFISSPETAAHLRFVDDAVAIRDRAVAMEAIAGRVLGRRERGSKVRWLSMASGTGEPSIAAAKHAADTNDLDIDLTVADINPRSLAFVKSIAEKYGFSSNVNTMIADITKMPNFVGQLIRKAGSDQFDIGEDMGWKEYLPQEGDELGACRDTGLPLPQASEFTRMAYERIVPGGSLISGNMVVDRPQIDFVFGVVDWPIINARSEESILRIYQEAGIPMEQIKLYRVRDELTGAHVYDIVEVSKPPLTKLDRASRMARNLLGRMTVQDAVAA